MSVPARMDTLPSELLGDIISMEDILTTKDVLNIACVSRLFHQIAGARLYRTGELSYIGATEADTRKVEAFSRNGQHVRTLTLSLCPRGTSPLKIPSEINRLLHPLTNLNSFTLIDANTLPWDDFTTILARLITTHIHLHHLELQCTLAPTDGTKPIPRARSILRPSAANPPARTCHLKTFTLRLAAKELPVNRTAIDHLIEILQPATRSVKSFRYSSSFHEPHQDDSDTPSKVQTRQRISWVWDNLEDLSVKVISYSRYRSPPRLGSQAVLPGYLGDVTSLAIKVGGEDIIHEMSYVFENGVSSLPAVERLRFSRSTGGIIARDPRHDKDHPLHAVARAFPKLKLIEQTDPYYLTQISQAWTVERGEESQVTIKPVAVNQLSPY